MHMKAFNKNGKCIESHSVISTLCNPMDYTVHGILQARILEWVACPFSSGSSQPRNRTGIVTPALQAVSLPAEPPGNPHSRQEHWLFLWYMQKSHLRHLSVDTSSRNLRACHTERCRVAQRGGRSLRSSWRGGGCFPRIGTKEKSTQSENIKKSQQIPSGTASWRQLRTIISHSTETCLMTGKYCLCLYWPPWGGLPTLFCLLQVRVSRSVVSDSLPPRGL